jgi:hypothetical protein
MLVSLILQNEVSRWVQLQRHNDRISIYVNFVTWVKWSYIDIDVLAHAFTRTDARLGDIGRGGLWVYTIGSSTLTNHIRLHCIRL